MPAGPKLVHLTFTIDQGPKYKLAGSRVRRQPRVQRRHAAQPHEGQQAQGLVVVLHVGRHVSARRSSPTTPTKVNEFYLDKGYVRARHRPAADRDGQRLQGRQDPLDPAARAGRRGQAVPHRHVHDCRATRPCKTEALRAHVQGRGRRVLQPRRRSRRASTRRRRSTAALGFWQCTPEPTPMPRGIDPNTGQPIGPDEPPRDRRRDDQDERGQAVLRQPHHVHRQHDDARRRGPARDCASTKAASSTREALKESIRRLNQLGYFKPLEGKEDEIRRAADAGHATASSTSSSSSRSRTATRFRSAPACRSSTGSSASCRIQTSNFLGRGETLGVNLQKGSRARQYQVSFSEPYLFDRPLTAGVDVYARQFIYPLPVHAGVDRRQRRSSAIRSREYARLFLGYGYEQITRLRHRPGLSDGRRFCAEPVPARFAAARSGRLPHGQQGHAVASSTTPSTSRFSRPRQAVHGVGRPRRASAATPYYAQSAVEGIWYYPARRIPSALSLGLRGEGQWITPARHARIALPIFEKFFLGGEYSVRGFDMRSDRPARPVTGIVTGGNKTLLFNGEFYFNIGGPGPAAGFYDAGQVRDVGEPFALDGVHHASRAADRGRCIDPFTSTILTPDPYVPQTEVWAKSHAFKTSTGVEVRFFMPVLNVPFRLIARLQPVALRRAQQQPPADEAVHVPLRGRHDVLDRVLDVHRWPRSIHAETNGWRRDWSGTRRGGGVRLRSPERQHGQPAPDADRARDRKFHGLAHGQWGADDLPFQAAVRPGSVQATLHTFGPETATQVGLVDRRLQRRGLHDVNRTCRSTPPPRGSSVTGNVATAAALCVRVYDVGNLDPDQYV